MALSSRDIRNKAELCIQIQGFLNTPKQFSQCTLGFVNGLATLPDDIFQKVWPVLQQAVKAEHNKIAKEIGCKTL